MKNKFSYSDCLKEAKECKSRSEFAKKNRSAYVVALNNGWLKEFSWLKRPVAHNKQYWDEEKCSKESQKYGSMTEFHEKSPTAYSVAKRNGWLQNYEWLSVKPMRWKWNHEKCMEEAKKYATRYEFRKGSPAAYEVSRKMGWLSEFNWFAEKPIAEMKKYVVYSYVDEENNAVYVGLTCDINQAHARRNMGVKKGKPDSAARYFISVGKKMPKPTILKDGMTNSEAMSYEAKVLDDYKKDGWGIINNSESAEDKDKCKGFLDAIVSAMYDDNGEDKSDTKNGFYMMFHDFNEWGDENPLRYGVDVYNNNDELVCSEEIGPYCGYNLRLFVPDSEHVLKLMAKNLAIKCGVIDAEPLPF